MGLYNNSRAHVFVTNRDFPFFSKFIRLGQAIPHIRVKRWVKTEHAALNYTNDDIVRYSGGIPVSQSSQLRWARGTSFQVSTISLLLKNVSLLLSQILCRRIFRGWRFPPTILGLSNVSHRYTSFAHSNCLRGVLQNA